MQADTTPNSIEHVLLTASDYNSPKPLNTLKPCNSYEESMTTKPKPTSEDKTSEDLDTLLAGLKQEQLDKLATELNKSKVTRNRDKDIADFKVKSARSRMIRAMSERLYKANRKGPHHFDDFKDFTAYDNKLRADTTAQAIEEYKEKDE